MADEQTSIEWWKNQVTQLKTELDTVNPKYDAQVIRIKELENQVQTQQIAVEVSHKKADEAATKALEIAQKYEELSNQYVELHNSHAALSDNQKAINESVEKAQKEAILERDKRRNVLSKVLEAAKNFVDECNAGLVGD